MEFSIPEGVDVFLNYTVGDDTKQHSLGFYLNVFIKYQTLDIEFLVIRFALH